MAGLKQPLQDILTQLSAIQVVNSNSQTVSLYSRLWNNQLRDVDKIAPWPMPSAFIELSPNVSFEILGQGFRNADLGIKIHLLHQYYNMDGTMEQDLTIYDLRDLIIEKLTSYCPTACGQMVCINESPDNDHDNVYHYILEFVCNFVDSKANPVDQGKEIEEIITGLDTNIVNGGVPPVAPDANPEFIIPQ